MDKSFKNSERLSPSFVYREGLILRSVFIIAFLFMIGLLGFFYPQGFLQKIGMIAFLILAIVGVAALVLSAIGILRYKAAQLYEDFDFSIFQNTNDAIIISDLCGFVYYSNQNYQKIFTYKPQSSCYAVIADLPGAGALAYRLKVAAWNDLAAQEQLRMEQPIFVHSSQKNLFGIISLFNQ